MYKKLKQMIERDQLKNKTYSEAIHQIIDNGEVEEIKENTIDFRNMERNINYLPLPEVFKFDRISTKCRIVINVRAKNSGGISLKSNLLPGPKRQLDIILSLINFRINQYTQVGDISRMFYCINQDEKHRDY